MRTEPTADERVPPAPDSFESFFRRLFPLVARTAALAVRDMDLGQDLAQESFARVFARWDRMTSDDHATNFVFRVALNLARSHQRHEARRRLLRLPVASAPPDESEASANRLTLRAALSGLSDRQRECLALVDYAGMDVGSAADILGMRASTVRVHLTRGRRTLAERLGETYREAFEP